MKTQNSKPQTPSPEDKPGLPVTQYVTLECGWCGHKGGQYLRHYDLLLCQCGRMFWALQPKRNGLLVLFPWPGRDLAEAERIGMRKAAA